MQKTVLLTIVFLEFLFLIYLSFPLIPRGEGPRTNITHDMLSHIYYERLAQEVAEVSRERPVYEDDLRISFTDATVEVRESVTASGCVAEQLAIYVLWPYFKCVRYVNREVCPGQFEDLSSLFETIFRDVELNKKLEDLISYSFDSSTAVTPYFSVNEEPLSLIQFDFSMSPGESELVRSIKQDANNVFAINSINVSYHYVLGFRRKKHNCLRFALVPDVNFTVQIKMPGNITSVNTTAYVDGEFVRVPNDFSVQGDELEGQFYLKYVDVPARFILVEICD